MSMKIKVLCTKVQDSSEKILDCPQTVLNFLKINYLVFIKIGGDCGLFHISLTKLIPHNS